LTTDSETLADSSSILHFADKFGNLNLYPSAIASDVEQTEKLFDDKLGPSARFVVYVHLFAKADLLDRIFRNACESSVDSSLLFVLGPVVRFLMRKGLGLDSKPRYDRHRERVFEVFEDVTKRLESSRYIIGDSFTAADLTFASLAYPVLFPDAMKRYVPVELKELDQDVSAMVEQLRATKAGQHALRMFAEHYVQPKGRL
jgi:glutathione S-transferase